MITVLPPTLLYIVSVAVFLRIASLSLAFTIFNVVFLGFHVAPLHRQPRNWLHRLQYVTFMPIYYCMHVYLLVYMSIYGVCVEVASFIDGPSDW